MKKYLLLVSVPLLFTSCKLKDENVKIQVTDPVRHYFPIVQGQQLKIEIPITNLGDAPLKIDDVFSSCGCTKVKKESAKIIGPGKTENIVLNYNSNKNVGTVEHHIQIYGNIEPKGHVEVKFDIRVIPNTNHRDYEDLLDSNEFENPKTSKNFEPKGYYTEHPPLYE